jgi:hypothetical protein
MNTTFLEITPVLQLEIVYPNIIKLRAKEFIIKNTYLNTFLSISQIRHNNV